jgi:hypothetical protein
VEISHDGYIEGSHGVVNGNLSESRINRNPTVKREIISAKCPYYIEVCIYYTKIGGTAKNALRPVNSGLRAFYFIKF